MTSLPAAGTSGPADGGPPVVLVTGSTSGIGEAVARSFAARGARVVLNSRSSVAAGEALAGELPGAIYLQADVSDPEQAAGLVARAVAACGRLDVLVNNAATTEVIPHADLDAATPEIFRRLYETNVIGPFTVTRAAAPHLAATGAGVVVNVSSLAGVRPVGSSIPYACSKAALNHLTLLLANTLGPAVRVVAVAPGLVDTPWTDDADPYWALIRQAVTSGAPLQRSATPQDVAATILGLVGSPYVTGQVVAVDGGLSLR